MASTTTPKWLLLAADGCPFGLDAHTDATRQLLAALGASVTVFHVIPDTGPQELAPLVFDSVARTGLVHELSAVKSHPAVNSAAATGILVTAQTNDYEPVVLIARRHSFVSSLFHHSVTAEVLRQSQLPGLPAQWLL